MKKVLSTLILAGCIIFCFAQRQPYSPGNERENQNIYSAQKGNFGRQSSLVVSSASQRQLSVSIDDRNYDNNGNDHTLKIGQVSAGNHRVMVFHWKRNFWGRRVKEVVYNSSLYLRQGYETSIFINDFGLAKISERQIYNNGNNGQGKYGNNGNGRDWGYSKMKHKRKKSKSNKYEEDRRDSDWHQDGRWERYND